MSGQALAAVFSKGFWIERGSGTRNNRAPHAAYPHGRALVPALEQCHALSAGNFFPIVCFESDFPYVRFRTNSEHLQGVERLAIMKVDTNMLEGPYKECPCLPGSHLH